MVRWLLARVNDLPAAQAGKASHVDTAGLGGRVSTPALVTGSAWHCPMLSNGGIDHSAADAGIGLRSCSAASLGSHSNSPTSGS